MLKKKKEEKKIYGKIFLNVNMAEDTAYDLHFIELSKNVRHSEVSYSLFRFMSKVEGRQHVTRGFSFLALLHTSVQSCRQECIRSPLNHK